MHDINIKFGHENFGNYQRLSYKWWYAIAEFVDNSTQSYFDNKEALDEILEIEQERFEVSITTSSDSDLVRVRDNAMGMDLEDLRRAMIIGVPPKDSSGRCRYGLGMKTSACWIGATWRIITSKLGADEEYTIEIDVGQIRDGNLTLNAVERKVPKGEHYTIVEIQRLHRPFRGRTVGKTKKYLSSIYRSDLASQQMRLRYNDADIEWKGFDITEFLVRKDGTPYRADFIFEVTTESGKKIVEGWVGVLRKGSRNRAGFSIMHRKRLITGWPDSWKPQKVYGEGGRNDLINQRLVGEINLEDFEVSHTKDAINWYGDEEDQVEEGLKAACSQYMETARKARGGEAPGHGPRPLHVAAAVQTLETELSTPEFVDMLEIEDAVPPIEQIEASKDQVVENATTGEAAFAVRIGAMTLRVYLDDLGSLNDPYFINQEVGESEVIVVVNVKHPHWSMLEGENSVTNYLRHCVYDAVAEHRAGRLRRQLESDTVKRLKDQYLRLAFEILQSDDE